MVFAGSEGPSSHYRTGSAKLGIISMFSKTKAGFYGYFDKFGFKKKEDREGPLDPDSLDVDVPIVLFSIVVLSGLDFTAHSLETDVFFLLISRI